MQLSNKYKTYIRCGCSACKNNMSKKVVYRHTKRQYRHNGKKELKSLVGFDLSTTNILSDNLTLGICASPYTD